MGDVGHRAVGAASARLLATIAVRAVPAVRHVNARSAFIERNDSQVSGQQRVIRVSSDESRRSNRRCAASFCTAVDSTMRNAPAAAGGFGPRRGAI